MQPTNPSSAMSNSLDVVNLPVNALAGVGTKLLSSWRSLKSMRVFDLLMHLPRDYEDRSRLVPMYELQHGQSALVEGIIARVERKNRHERVLARAAVRWAGDFTLFYRVPWFD